MKTLVQALRERIALIEAFGFDSTELRHAADELDHIDREMRRDQQSEIILEALQELQNSFAQSSAWDEERHEALRHTIHQLKGMIIMLKQDIDAAVAQIALNTSAEASAAAALGLLSKQVVDLTAQLGAIVPGEVVDPATIAALKAATSGMATSLTALTSAIPANVVVPPPVIVPPAPVQIQDPVLVQAAADALAASDAAAAAAAADPTNTTLATAAADALAASNKAAADLAAAPLVTVDIPALTATAAADLAASDAATAAAAAAPSDQALATAAMDALNKSAASAAALLAAQPHLLASTLRFVSANPAAGAL